jgi:hypothetical protein
MLKPTDYKHYIDRFNADDAEEVINLVPNSAAWDWISSNCPLLDCPDKTIEEIYYFRWWTFRKHIVQTPAGRLMTEFILPVKHAGIYNTVSCALGHHIAEGRWVRQQSWLDEYARFWFRGNDGAPQTHFHKYSQWTAAALLDRAHVTDEMTFLIDLLPDLVRDYARWEEEKRLPDGLFWQYDVWDGMEESISGSRTQKNRRPTINSYMYANALAISEIAHNAGQEDLASTYAVKARELLELVQAKLWDSQAQFFKVMFEDESLSDAREVIGFIPWCFGIPFADQSHAWMQFTDPQGFDAPRGITTAERRHPKFRSHGVGKCEWDGAVWPFATSQTLNALANYLRTPHTESHDPRPRHAGGGPAGGPVNSEKLPSSADYLRAVQTYARSHFRAGKAYIGEYLDETTGEWLKGDHPRSRFYNHSTFADLIIQGLIGLIPRADSVIEIHPLLPADSWDWFCLDHIHYHHHVITIIWDRTGQRYGKQAGLHVLVNDREVARSPDLGPLLAQMD